MMKILVKNTNLSISFALTALRLFGLWAPDEMNRSQKIVYYCYAVVAFMVLLGIYLMIQAIDLFLIWGDLPMMTSVAFILFTNLAQCAKILNILIRKKKIQKIISENDKVLRQASSKAGRDIVKSCNREISFLLCVYLLLTSITMVGWATSAENNKLPLQAWYPYDTTKSPAFELTFTHQVVALILAAYLNIGKDTLVVTLIAQCRCRLRLLGLALKNLCQGFPVNENSSFSRTMPLREYMLTVKEEETVQYRLKRCVIEHQKVLHTTQHLQFCFSEPTFLQFNVSLIIICVTAFQLVFQTSNLVRFMAMSTYLVNMMFQVFIYCYQGSYLTAESAEVAGAAYECPWYTCNVQTRKSIFLLMLRCQRVVKITATGFTTLSLATFMAILKLSYSLFTLLQQVNENN